MVWPGYTRGARFTRGWEPLDGVYLARCDRSEFIIKAKTDTSGRQLTGMTFQRAG